MSSLTLAWRVTVLSCDVQKSINNNYKWLISVQKNNANPSKLFFSEWPGWFQTHTNTGSQSPPDSVTLSISSWDKATHTHRLNFTQPIKPQVYQGTRRQTSDDEPGPEGPWYASRVRVILVSLCRHDTVQQPLITSSSSNTTKVLTPALQTRTLAIKKI